MVVAGQIPKWRYKLASTFLGVDGGFRRLDHALLSSRGTRSPRTRRRTPDPTDQLRADHVDGRLPDFEFNAIEAHLSE